MAMALKNSYPDSYSDQLFRLYFPKAWEDEEEDLYWSENAVELIAKLGEQNWLLTQL